MANWADYGISAKMKDTRILNVKVHVIGNNNTIGKGRIWHCWEVISEIKTGSTFVTIVKGSKGKWRKGAKVRIMKMLAREYIRTDRGNVTKDNLGNLPDYWVSSRRRKRQIKV